MTTSRLKITILSSWRVVICFLGRAVDRLLQYIVSIIKAIVLAKALQNMVDEGDIKF